MKYWVSHYLKQEEMDLEFSKAKEQANFSSHTAQLKYPLQEKSDHKEGGQYC